ncbi:MAG: hypothetical protein ACRELY_04400 [Polyangiaceae bacterium]
MGPRDADEPELVCEAGVGVVAGVVFAAAVVAPAVENGAGGGVALVVGAGGAVGSIACANEVRAPAKGPAPTTGVDPATAVVVAEGAALELVTVFVGGVGDEARVTIK